MHRCGKCNNPTGVFNKACPGYVAEQARVRKWRQFEHDMKLWELGILDFEPEEPDV